MEHLDGRRTRGSTLVAAAGLSAAILLLLAAITGMPAAFAAPALGMTPGAGASTASGNVVAGGSWTAQQPAAGLGLAPASGRAMASAAAALVALAATALIVQNKGGGHGEIGYHLALKLAKEKGLKVTMITDSAAKTSKPPFDSYKDLEAAGVELKTADFKEGASIAATLKGVGPFDYVFDNDNVCTKDVIRAAAGWRPKAFAYVSSGGMYKPVGDGPLLETGAVKDDNKQLGLEKLAKDFGLNWSAYRPQYIYGPKTAKPEYLDWFLDRITRDVPVPLPGDGSFRTTVTHAADVAGMLASVVGKEAEANGQVFNCATDVRISHMEIVELCARAVGKDPAAVMSKVMFYDPAKLKGVELPKKGGFPFRDAHFGVGVEKAKQVLGWSPTNKLQDDLAWYYADYKARGKDTGDIVRDWDEAVMKIVAA